VPKADITRYSITSSACLLERSEYVELQRFSGFEVDNKFELGRLLLTDKSGH